MEVLNTTTSAESIVKPIRAISIGTLTIKHTTHYDSYPKMCCVGGHLQGASIIISENVEKHIIGAWVSGGGRRNKMKGLKGDTKNVTGK